MSLTTKLSSQDKTGPVVRTPWLIGLLFATVLLTFHRTLSLSFVQDDWTLLYQAQTEPLAELLASAFQMGGFFYRPAGMAYLYILFKLFGEHAAVVHCLGLLLHLANSWLVFWLIRRLCRSELTGALCAVLYAAAVAIHLDSLSWAVGIYDLGGALCFLGCLALFLSGKTKQSALCLLAGVLFKETLAITPAVLLLISAGCGKTCSIRRLLDDSWRLAPQFAIALGALAVKAHNHVSPLALPASHPYAMRLTGFHLVDNLWRYAAWMLQSVVPVDAQGWLKSAIVLVAFAMVACAYRVAGRDDRRALLCLALWCFLALLPTLFLVNHTYRYYATYALPAFLAILLLSGRILMLRVWGNGATNVALSLIVAASAVGSMLQANAIFNQGLNAHTMQDATNLLVSRAATVQLVHAALQRNLPTAPPGAILVFENVDLWSFSKDIGPKLWYHDPTIRVFAIDDIHAVAGAFAVNNDAAGAPLLGDRLFGFKRTGDTIAPIELRKRD